MRRLLLFVALVLVGYIASAQSLDALNAEVRRAEKEIAINEKLLGDVKSDKSTNQRELNLRRSKISNRRKIVSSLDKQIALLEADIMDKSNNVSRLKLRQTALQHSYAGTIRSSYKNYLLNNSILFLFSSSDFNDLTLRAYYMKRQNRFRKQQATELDSMTRAVGAEIEVLNTKVAEIEQTRQNRNREMAALTKEEQQLAQVAAKLKKQESTITSTIREKKRQKSRAEAEIQRIMTAETKRSKNKTRSNIEQKEYDGYTRSFEQLTGQMSYPVADGVIVERASDSRNNSNKLWINIAAAKGATVKSVGDGVVLLVTPVMGLNTAILVGHGDYYTTYANLVGVAVKKGDKVKKNQKIGNLSTGTDSNDYYLHFELWRNFTSLDPEMWLKR